MIMRSRSLSHLFCFLAILTWSTHEILSKFVHLSPYTLTAWRFFIGGLVILPFALKALRDNPQKPRLKDLALMALLGILNVCISMLLLQVSVHYGKASISAVLVSSNPLFVSVFAMLILREKLSLPQILGLIVASVGIILLIFGEVDFGADKYLNLPLSFVYGLGASLSFGLYLVLTKKTVEKHGNVVTNGFSFFFGAIVLFVINAIIGEPLGFELTLVNAGAMFWFGVIISGLSYVLFFEGAKLLGAGTSSMYFFLKPVLASLLALIVLSEKLAPLQLIAIAVIVGGLTLSRVLKPAPSPRKSRA